MHVDSNIIGIEAEDDGTGEPWLEVQIDAYQRGVAAILEDRGRSRHLLLDHAAWHTTGNLVVPKNMTLIFLPSRAPELNSVETIRQYLRANWFSNRVFTSARFRLQAASGPEADRSAQGPCRRAQFIKGGQRIWLQSEEVSDAIVAVVRSRAIRTSGKKTTSTELVSSVFKISGVPAMGGEATRDR